MLLTRHGVQICRLTKNRIGFNVWQNITQLDKMTKLEHDRSAGFCNRNFGKCVSGCGSNTIKGNCPICDDGDLPSSLFSNLKLEEVI